MNARIIDRNVNATNENTGYSIHLTELDREFLFLYGLSTLARYRVNDWSEIIAGQTSDQILRIDRYLQSIQSLFPNLILNTLYNEWIIFTTIGDIRDHGISF